MKQDVTQQVEKVLSSLDQVNRASVSPYYHSGIIIFISAEYISAFESKRPPRTKMD
jgi:hypothetical protein